MATIATSRQCGALTLIELLVVTSIFALLVSILLPAPRHALSVAEAAQCKSRQTPTSMATFRHEPYRVRTFCTGAAPGEGTFNTGPDSLYGF